MVYVGFLFSLCAQVRQSFRLLLTCTAQFGCEFLRGLEGVFMIPGHVSVNDAPDRIVERSHSIAVIAQQRNTQRTNSFGNLSLKYFQGAWGLTGYQDAIASRQQMANQVCDCM